MNADASPVLRRSRPRKVEPEPEHDQQRSDASTIAKPPSEGQTEPLRYVLKNENPHCWCIAILRRRKGGDRYEGRHWFTTLEQACDRLVELYLHEDIAWEVVNLADVRKAISELKSSLTDEMLNRMIIR